MRIVGYTFQAANYCPACIMGAMTPNGHNRVSAGDSETELDALALAADIDRYDEYSFDSDIFPKVIFSTQVETDESCLECGANL